MDTFQLFERMAVALAIGLLIGVERGWQERDEDTGSRTAGLRTHALLSLLGAVAAGIDLARGAGSVTVTAVAFAVSAMAMTLFRYRETQRDGTFGATTLVASMLAFLLGAYAVIGDMQVAAAAGVAAAGLLSLKSFLHGFLRRVMWGELRSALLLLAMTVILLPVLPNRAVDPWEAINPYELWLLTIMIAALSFAGYLAIKLGGDKLGVVLSGIAGGLVSSTAVTLTLSRLARAHPERAGTLLAGVLFAGATMIARTLLIVGLVNVRMLPGVLWPALAVGAVLAGAGAMYLRGSDTGERSEEQIALGNPFDPLAVLSFGALLTAITLLAKIASAWAGSLGAYVLAAATGFADVDSITLSMARLGGSQIALSTAGTAVLIAIGVNSISKAVLATAVGGARIGRPMALTTAIALVAGAIGYAVAHML